MNKDFVPYNESLELKELGFDEECFRYGDSDSSYIDTPSSIEERMINPFNKTIKIPTFSQAFRWFREKYNLFYDILQYIDKDWKYTTYSDNVDDFSQSGFYRTYEEAELDCLQKLIQIVKDEKHTHTTN